MKKTQLIVFERPNNGLVLNSTILNTTNLQQENEATYSGFGSQLQNRGQSNIIRRGDPYIYDPQAQGIEIDLYDDVSIPITYNIIDVREPEKRKTSWSKTITVPGTKNNNKVFSHIYEIGGDNWVKIRGRSVWSAFNPNLKTEVVILNEGVQILKGNMQLKSVTKDDAGNIEYEISLNGDLTSLFFDIGNKKLNDLDWSEWSHTWSKDNVVNSWSGFCRKADGSQYYNLAINSTFNLSNCFKDETTGRLSFTTTSNHSLIEGDWVLILGDTSGNNSKFLTIFGQYVVTNKISNTKFSVNHFYPKALVGSTQTLTGWAAYKTQHTGRGYVYPMIAWGTEFDYNSFPVTSFIPGFFVKEVLDKVFAETNSNYVSNFFDSEFFKRLILIQRRGSYDLTPLAVQQRKFWVGTTQSFYTAASALATGQNYRIYSQFDTPDTATFSLTGSLNPNRVKMRAESGNVGTQSFYDQYNNWSQDNNSWTVQQSGEYQLNASFKYSVWCDMNGYNTEIFPDGTASFQPSNTYFKYYPGLFPANANPGGTNGLVIRARLRRKRNGQLMPDLGVYEYPLNMNRESYWTSANDQSLNNGTGNWAYFGRYQPSSWRNVQVNLTSTTTYFAEGDEVWLEISTYVNAPSADPSIDPLRNMALSFYESYYDPTGFDPIQIKFIRGEWSFRIEPNLFLYTDPSTKASENSFIEGAQFLPNEMTCKDFLLSIIKMFNLHIEPDKQIERKYYIEPRDEFYFTGANGESDYADWTDKIDNSNIEIIPVGELIAKNYIFSNREENDYWNKRFKDDRGRAYSYYNKTILNDFLTNEAKIEVPMGSTVMVNNPEGSDVVMPAIYQRESTGAAKPVSNSLPRILIYAGIKPYTAQRGGSTINLANPAIQNGTGWEILSSVATPNITSTSSNYNYYPYAGTVDSPNDPYYDINWYNMEQGDFVYWDIARWTNDNLYNEYWSNFINEISDPSSKVIRCFVKLTPVDIYNLDFRRIYIIDGNYLRLQKVIDYDPVSDNLTQCEFLKLKSPVKYRRKSIVVDDFGYGDTYYEPDTLPIIGDNPFVYDYAPIRKRPDFGFNNTAPSVSTSNNQTITLNGLSNFVASSAKNVKVNGNENAVGDNSQNIHISSGNGNFIVGGVENVNIIGTNKKFINESDVTYINGIRYKNGSPISRASVIDAGADIALVRQSNNTTSNVVDASEDVVITAGSTSFENVMDSGVDRILPDVPDLGLGTNLNPNPRTNFLGAFVETSATASITARVREARFYKQ